MPSIPSEKAWQQQEKPKLCCISDSLGYLARFTVDHDVKPEAFWLVFAHDHDPASCFS
jgi:hypothetical protein